MKFSVLVCKPSGKIQAEFVRYRDHMELISYNDAPAVISQKIANGITCSRYDNIIIISPHQEEHIHDILFRFKSNFSAEEILITEPVEYVGDLLPGANSSIAFNKKLYRGVDLIPQASYKDVISSIVCKSLSSKKTVEELKKKVNIKKRLDTGPAKTPTFLKNSIELSDKKPANISIILPFAYNGDRWRIFDVVVKNLKKLIEPYNNIELCIHESSPKRFITDDYIKENNLRYMYTKWDETFHRSWNLNIAARYLASGSYFCFFDGDMLVDQLWLDELLKASELKFYGHGWGKLIYVPEVITEEFFRCDCILPKKFSYNMEREPHFWNCAGGINVISRDDFFLIYGWPEDFRGMWGGPDNAYVLKQMAFDMYQGTFKSTIYHLHHSHITHGDKEARRRILEPMRNWSAYDWKNHLRICEGWGDLSQTKEVVMRNI